ncbi:MAG: transcription-repair coupling factor [Spirochaetaceae bacterium]|nr:transcription-repair coupling factor [Spirochaetaceae bacterium]
MESIFNNLLACTKADTIFSKANSFLNGSNYPAVLKNMHGSFLAFFLTGLKAKLPLLIVVSNSDEANSLAADFTTFGLTANLFPNLETNLYQPSPVSGLRQSALNKMAVSAINIITVRDFIRRTAPPNYAKELNFKLTKGIKTGPAELSDKLSSFGYLRVPRVSVAGEYAVRGEVVDVFMHGEEAAHRLQFAFDEIEEIKSFEIQTQMSLQSFNSLTIPAAREALFTAQEVKTLENKWNAGYGKKGLSLPTNDLLNAGRYQEIFMPLLFNESYSVIDYLPNEAVLILNDYSKLERAAESFESEADELYKRAIRTGLGVPPPSEILNNFTGLINRKKELITLNNNFEGKAVNILPHEGPRSFFGNINLLKEELSSLAKNGYSTFIFAENNEQALRIETLFKDYPVTVIPEGLSAGFCLPSSKLMVICEHELFGRKKRTAGNIRKVSSRAIDSFIELNAGDYVVHINHGIGQFIGIERLKAAGSERDYIVLEYAGGDRIFVPIEQVNLVERFIGGGGEKPKLDSIGGKSWQNRKSKASKAAEELANYLIDIYAKRESSLGFAFPPDDEFQLEFEADFPYTETPDQLESMREIKADMELIRPMDRLVIGDVGYGKTELAMRSAFKAAMAGKQTAILCPTTILAEQHFNNFLERFKRFDFVRIALLSRFVDRAQLNKNLLAIKNGEADIVIGTHRLLSKDVEFRNLGLMIVDEEQRFGVKDKEKIKALKSNIDALALSATPIPRTLQMSLVKIRDLSTLKTPPANRQPVETMVNPYNAEQVSAAIRAELERGGQIFYLHNRVTSLEATASFVRSLVPEALVDVAHGQMNADELDDVMHRFVHGGFNVLVSTTIIESGIDIPNVNTIIIDRADMYGVSQLYQLKGRVGRSDRVAYAYLLYPDQIALDEPAMKRLQIISDFTELGSGFKIAMKDMEVRGAGNLLGREQSGQIHAVGLDMYLKMIDEAIRAKTGADDDKFETLLELEYSGFIPDSYISGTLEKMEIYKKIAGVMTEDELAGLHSEINDRFGPPPDEVSSFFSLAEIKILCRNLKIKSLLEKEGTLEIEFAKFTAISVQSIMRQIAESGGKLKPNPKNAAGLLLTIGKVSLKEKSEYIRDYLARLAA